MRSKKILHYKENRLVYDVSGQKDGVVVILLHGLFGDRTIWNKTVPQLSQEYRVITLDYYGHGESDLNITPKTAADVFTEVLQHLLREESVERFFLVGHSISGNLILNFIETSQIKALGYVFVDCTFNSSDDVIDSRNEWADHLLGYEMSARREQIENWYQSMMDLQENPEDNQLILSGIPKTDYDWPLRFVKATNIRRVAPKGGFKDVMLFESDWLTAKGVERSFRNAFPEAQFSFWPKGSHFFFVYQSEKFNVELTKFLKAQME